MQKSEWKRAKKNVSACRRVGIRYNFVSRANTKFQGRDQDKDVNVIFAIFTDGYENDSAEYSWKKVSEMISKRTGKGWEFLFLAANEDAIATASNLNIKSHNASQVQFTEDAMGSWGDSVSSKAKAMRLKSMDLNYDKACYMQSLSDIVEDDLEKLKEEKKNIQQ